MKKYAQKARIAALALSFCTVTLAGSAQNSNNCKGTKKVEVLFNKHMDRKDLDRIAADLARKSFRITYLQRKFDAAGHLSYLKFSVETPDGFSGNAGATLTGQKFGFIRNCRNKMTPFVVGNL